MISSDSPTPLEAAVALLLRPGSSGPELLLVRRALYEGDPWSGHVALPGGRREPGDRDLRQTAVRETREEVGIDLRRDGTFREALPEVAPITRRAPPFRVVPFRFDVPKGTAGSPGPEIETLAWIPLEELRDARSGAEHRVRDPEGAGERVFPALAARGFLVWGLTYRVLQGFLDPNR